MHSASRCLIGERERGERVGEAVPAESGDLLSVAASRLPDPALCGLSDFVDAGSVHVDLTTPSK
ncbi:hypothetical protein BJ970_003629 [Saccharopolyspora phatthalungensis]|uniref:Uncharacterized protein n=1 Tax=Saccharopolyspora phatthalungensis TaxID=664693 RepID=A0A840QCC1_9PSEU|nr:hypothetical protein [Saccharopolyspora phatthalungensis]